MDKQWYFGPEGRLMPLFCPEEGIQMDTVRFGGVHTGLSGAVTRDLTGVRNQYTFNWEKLEQEDYDYLEAYNANLVPGSYFLVNPLKKNRLSLRTSTAAPNAQLRQAIDVGLTYTQWKNDWPPGVPFGSRSFRWFGYYTDDTQMWFDDWSRTPVFDGETITGSLYVKPEYEGSDWNLGFELYRNGVYDSDTGTDVSLPVGEWTRMTTSLDVPDGITSVVMKLNPSHASNGVLVAAPQLERGSSATTFSLGGGAPSVVIDQMTSASPRFGLYDVELTLLEV